MSDESELVRCWFEFDMSDDRPPPESPGIVSIDGGTLVYRCYGRGAGVTGMDEQDCLDQLRKAVDVEVLPSVVRLVVDVDVASLPLLPSEIGVPAWRGVWFPKWNLRGPSDFGR